MQIVQLVRRDSGHFPETTAGLMKHLVHFMLTLCPLGVFSQEISRVLYGQITDAENGNPLTHAYVFVDRTTMGARTDHEGRYRLENLPHGNLEIRVTYIGYITATAKIAAANTARQEFSVGLHAGIDLNTVVVNAKADHSRNMMLKTVFTELIGDNRFRKQCRVINPEAISVKLTADGHLSGSSSEPIVIENNALGYRIY